MSQSAEFVVRIPEHFFDAFHTGEIRASEFVTISLLYNWANWNTGTVPFVSAQGLSTWSRKAYSTKTFSTALQRLEQMGHITRHMVRGSHHDYPVMLHNYPKLDMAGKVLMINAKETSTWNEIENTRGDETSYEGSDETSDKVLSNNQSNNLSEDKSKSKEGRKEGRNPSSVASLPSLPPTGVEREPRREFFHFGLFPDWLKPLDKKATEEELERADEPYVLWQEKTGTGFLMSTGEEEYSDSNAAIRLFRREGFETVMDILRGTWECPKTAGITWKDFSFWCEKFDVTRSNVLAWRNKVMAQKQAKDIINGKVVMAKPTVANSANAFETEEL